MPKQQEDYHPPVEEVPTGESVSMPDAEYLDALLRDSKNVLSVAMIPAIEIDEMIERRQELLGRLQDVDIIRESRLQKVENYNPLGELMPSDYERLVQEGIIDASYAERLKELDNTITKFESIDNPSADVVVKLEELVGVRNMCREKLESQIEECSQGMEILREAIKNRVLDHYAKRTNELEQIITEIESNPRVIERLQTVAKQEMEELFAKREREKQEATARIEKERKAIIEEATRCIQSLEARHNNAFKRLSELTDNEKIVDELLQILSKEDTRKQQSVFDKVRNSLINSIIDGEAEKQLKEAKEIVPWRTGSTSIQYGEAIDFLRFHETEKTLQIVANAGDEKAKKLLERRNRIINGNEIIRRLVGPQWVTDQKTNKKRMGVFWAAFETRKNNDEKGITDLRKKEREEAAKREALFKKSIEDMVSRGGFPVEIPIIKEIRGQRRVVGRERGAVRLEKGKSKKGNEFWKVVEIFGATNGLKVGDVSPLNMRSFPVWVRESAKSYFVMHGEDFDERLVYEKE